MGADGARVVVSDRDGDELRELADRIGAHPVVADIASDGGVQQLISASLEAPRSYRRPSSPMPGSPWARGSPARTRSHWASILDINLLAHVRAARALEPVWEVQGGGRFVVTASAAGLLTILDDPSYAVTKHAAVAFAEWLSITYRHRGVVVQAICPQGVQTRMLEASGELESCSATTRRCPRNGWRTPLQRR